MQKFLAIASLVTTVAGIVAPLAGSVLPKTGVAIAAVGLGAQAITKPVVDIAGIIRNVRDQFTK